MMLSAAEDDCGCGNSEDQSIPRDQVAINELQLPARSGSAVAAALSRNPDSLASVVYQPMDEIPATQQGAQNYFSVTTGSAFGIDEAMLRLALQTAPMEFTAAARTSALPVALPRPDGTLERFSVVESPVMAKALAAQFPEIKTYSGVSIDHPGNSIRFGVTHQGFHAQVLSSEGAYYVSPYYHLSREAYVSYFKADGRMNTPINFSEEEGLLEQARTIAEHDHDDAPVLNSTEASAGQFLRTYDTAIATTGEYSAFHGGTTPLVLSALTAAVNLMNGPYDKDLSIRMQLVANQTSVIFLSSASDPFTSPSSVGTTQTQTQSTLDNIIGAANYDIGHVLHRGSDNGNAGAIGSVGVNGIKGRGYSSGSNPTITTWVIDYISHEMGHQYAGRHNFNNCSGSQGGEPNGTAVEPGSGTTIMGYAGICGSTNVQPNSDAMFHAQTIEQILTYVNTPGGAGNTSATITNTGNTIPTIDAGLDYTIPANTPFELTATGSDPDAGNVLTYSWDQRNGSSPVALGTDNGVGPLFRSWLPTTSNTRAFPRINNLVNNTVPLGEKLPTTNRTMTFTVTVRDGNAANGGVNQDNVTVTSTTAAGPFTVTSQNSSGITYDANTQQTVTWNVANTNNAPINAANVNILLSNDGGFTYSTVLAANVPNDGSEIITIPNIGTTTARIKVQPVGNIFFDINNFNFTINAVIVNPPSAPDLTDGSDSGNSNTDDITNDPTPTFSGVSEPGATITIYAAGFPVGSGTADGGGAWSVTSDFLSDGVYAITATATVGGNTSLASSPLSITIDTTAPTLDSSSFAFETGHLEGLVFSEDVGSSLSTSTIEVFNETTSTAVPPASLAVNFVAATNTAELTFPGFAGGILPDGNYTVTLTSAVSDLAGNALFGRDTATFFVFAGDANRDRIVDIADFALLSSNFNLPGTFSQGDFDYTGTTDLGDFAILAGKFNQALPAPRALPVQPNQTTSLASLAPSPSPFAGDKRIVADVLA